MKIKQWMKPGIVVTYNAATQLVLHTCPLHCAKATVGQASVMFTVENNHQKKLKTHKQFGIQNNITSRQLTVGLHGVNSTKMLAVQKSC